MVRYLFFGLVIVLTACADLPLTEPPPPPATERPPETGPVSVRLEPVADGFNAPLALATDGTSATFHIVTQLGIIYRIEPDGNNRSVFLDVSDDMIEVNTNYDERGLIGFTFHNNFPDDPRLFVHYSGPKTEAAPDDWDHASTVVSYEVDEDGSVDLSSKQVLLRVDQPGNAHNGGQLAFGPDGYLYIGIGDGGGEGDPFNMGQDRSELLATILRIDVNGEQPYTIPSDNPFVESEGAPEVYAYGFRNPYRFSFDPLTNDLWVGDVGQALHEEVNIVQKGGNYGWSTFEAFSCFNIENMAAPLSSCETTDEYGVYRELPVLEYNHAEGVAVVGGHVYRGNLIDALYGRYVFADWSGILWVATPSEDGWQRMPLPVNGSEDGQLGANILAISVDEDGELYVLTNEGGLSIW